MNMEIIYFLVLAAIAVQVGLFFMNKQKKKAVRDALLDKYNIKNRGDLFTVINSHRIPEEDRLLLEKLYQDRN